MTQDSAAVILKKIIKTLASVAGTAKTDGVLGGTSALREHLARGGLTFLERFFDHPTGGPRNSYLPLALVRVLT
jgi:hypothetical protein